MKGLPDVSREGLALARREPFEAAVLFQMPESGMGWAMDNWEVESWAVDSWATSLKNSESCGKHETNETCVNCVSDVEQTYALVN